MHYDYNAIDSATGEISAPDWFKELDAAKGDVSSLLFDNDDAFMVCRVFFRSLPYDSESVLKIDCCCNESMNGRSR